MAGNSKLIPIIDFSAYSLERSSPDEERFGDLINRITDALTSIGFVYLKNHGVPKDEIDNAMAQAKNFFELPLDVKLKYARGEKAEDKNNHGYLESEREKLNTERPGDFKECFNYIRKDSAKKMPDKEVPGFNDAISTLYDKSALLGSRVLEIIGRGLYLEDPYLFVKAHKGVGTEVSDTTMRCLYYPPLPEGADDLKPGQMRLGEHSDYGSLTLVYQDYHGGLEVETKTGMFVAATPIEGTIILNMGDLMQRWTADKVVSTVHRVVLPPNFEARHTFRQSISFFYQPDNTCVIKCVDGSNKYPPITSDVYLDQKYDATYTH